MSQVTPMGIKTSRISKKECQGGYWLRKAKESAAGGGIGGLWEPLVSERTEGIAAFPAFEGVGSDYDLFWESKLFGCWRSNGLELVIFPPELLPF
jgi:hypothetical protein